MRLFAVPTALSFAGKKTAAAPSKRTIQCEVGRVQSGLSQDLLNKEWQAKNIASGNPLVGHCYVAAEALFHRLGGKKAGWQSYVLNHKVWPEGLAEGETHWFLKHQSGRIADPTELQFDGQPIAYDRGVACGFLTQKPSKRAQTVLSRIIEKLKRFANPDF